MGYEPKRTPGNVGSRMRPFDEARQYVRGLRFTRQTEYQNWAKSGQRPNDVPGNPDLTYKGKGWMSWPDWLGYAEGRPLRTEFRTIEEAREYVRELRFNSTLEYQYWSRSGQRPDDVPSNPDQTYKGKGWIDWQDWLGLKET